MKQMPFFTLAFLLCLPTFLEAQSPWPRNKAGFFIQAAWQTIPAYTEVFESANDVNVPLDREISEHSFQIYGEYGLDKNSTLVASLPVRYLRNGNVVSSNFSTPRGSLTGLGNASLGLRRAILKGKLRLTGTLRLDFPTNTYSTATGLRTGYNAWTLQPTLSTGMGFGKIYWFGYAGMGLRTGGYSHFFDLGGEAGIKLGRCWLIGFSQFLYSLENGDVQLPLENRASHLFIDKQGWWSLGGKTIVSINRFVGVTASVAGAGWGQYVPKSPGISVGAFFNWE